MQTEQTASIGFAWDLADDTAAAWAIRYGDELTGALAKTTTPRIQRLIADWVNNGEPLEKLIPRVMGSYLYDYERAKTIAVTEVTRAFARGNLEAWQASGVVQRKRWNTAADEMVCPVCGPLNGQVVGLAETFPTAFGRVEGPPAHPRCRCWVTAVIEIEDGDTALDRFMFRLERDEEIEAINQSTVDPFAAIRPPEGRAPRGKGEEYRLRRRIVSRIRVQDRYRGQIERWLNNYRGQQNQAWRATRYRERLAILNKTIADMMTIAEMDGDWKFKAELIDGMIEFLQSQTAQLDDRR